MGRGQLREMQENKLFYKPMRGYSEWLQTKGCFKSSARCGGILAVLPANGTHSKQIVMDT
jgi:hypothetical protein